MHSEKIAFAGAAGAVLAARLDRPEGSVRATAILSHRFKGSKDIAAARRILGRLAALGIAVLRFDFTGLGQSAGKFTIVNFLSKVAEAEASGFRQDIRIGGAHQPVADEPLSMGGTDLGPRSLSAFVRSPCSLHHDDPAALCPPQGHPAGPCGLRRYAQQMPHRSLRHLRQDPTRGRCLSSPTPAGRRSDQSRSR